MMTRQEIDRKKEIAAGTLLSKSGVGGIFAHNALGPLFREKVREIGLAGSDDEAMVKVAIQFAFTDMAGFRKFILEQSHTESHLRKFRVRR